MARELSPENESLPATKKQTWTIFKLGGGDVRDQNLTRKQASDMIKDLMSKKGVDPNKNGPVVSYAAIVDEAIQAANEAGDKWWQEHQKPAYNVKDGFTGEILGQLYDVCGIVHIQVTDRRTRFIKWAKENSFVGYSGYSIHIPHKYKSRQEMGLLEACEKAALAVFQKHGIKGLKLYSRID